MKLQSCGSLLHHRPQPLRGGIGGIAQDQQSSQSRDEFFEDLKSLVVEQRATSEAGQVPPGVCKTVYEPIRDRVVHMEKDDGSTCEVAALAARTVWGSKATIRSTRSRTHSRAVICAASSSSRLR